MTEPHALPLDERQALNLGSGRRARPDAINVDLVADIGPDMVLNLQNLPWPFPHDRFDEILTRDVIEHLDNVVATLEEVIKDAGTT